MQICDSCTKQFKIFCENSKKGQSIIFLKLFCKILSQKHLGCAGGGAELCNKAVCVPKIKYKRIQQGQAPPS